MNNNYTAQNIEVLEGLEPVRKRPGMYIGGTDERALHHLVNEIVDNAVDEVVAGFAKNIAIHLLGDGSIKIIDDGRGIPVDPHPKFPGISALEVILTTLHSGGKFSEGAYQTSGGLHGVGLSVVNALSKKLIVTVARDGKIWTQEYSQGHKTSELSSQPTTNKVCGTSIQFYPDPEIFPDCTFSPGKIYHFVKSKAYLFKGAKINWHCERALISENDPTPTKDVLHFPHGVADYISTYLSNDEQRAYIFTGSNNLTKAHERIEWAFFFNDEDKTFINSFCNTIPTPQGGYHVTALRNSLLKSFRSFAELSGNKKSAQITSEDIAPFVCGILSVFITNPQFQGQTKDKLVNSEIQRPIENVIKDHLDNWLMRNKEIADNILHNIIEKSEHRLASKNEKEKKSATRIKLPHKLADCSRKIAQGTELFLVEGDSAGGSAKQARNRENQAILPLRGKILNVVSSSDDKFAGNQELKDLLLALGCGVKSNYSAEKLRYEKIIIMTDADVDGAHIASLLMSFFFQMTPDLIRNGHLYLAKPPLFKLVIGKDTHYAANEAERDKLVSKLGKNKKIEISRFKGLGEMSAHQLKETTMDPATRTLVKIIPDPTEEITIAILNDLMGKNPEQRLKFIQEKIKNDFQDVKDEILGS